MGISNSLGRSIAFAGALVCALPLLADSPKPRVLLVVDTSGSMNSSLIGGNPLGGDGTENYPGDDEIGGVPHTDCDGYPNPTVPGLNCSRMLQIRQVLSDVISAAPGGTGLMRYAQREAASEIELLDLDSGFYTSLDNLTTMTNYEGVGCGSYDFGNPNYWSTNRGSAATHDHGGDLLVEIPLDDTLDTRHHAVRWFDNRELWWAGTDPWDLDYVTWSETLTIDDGGYPLTSFVNKELRSASDYSVTISTLHEAWAYMKWVRDQDPLGETRRYLVLAFFDGGDGCGHDVTDLDVYWNLRAPGVNCQERFAVDECPAIELYLVEHPGFSAMTQAMANVAWSGTTTGSALSQGRCIGNSTATDLSAFVRAVLFDADRTALFADGFGLGDTSRWSVTNP